MTGGEIDKLWEKRKTWLTVDNFFVIYILEDFRTNYKQIEQ